MEEVNFNWYSIINGESDITQGDIIINFPIIRIKNYADISKIDLENIRSFKAKYGIEYSDFIVLTQPCEIAQKKVDLRDIILCGIHDVDDYVKKSKCGKGKLCEIIDGKRPQFYMLNKCDKFNYKDTIFTMDKFNFHIVDFSLIERIPLEVLQDYVKKAPKRLRLLPPYREHLSQAFAKYFMRIGLPSNINKDLFSKYAK